MACWPRRRQLRRLEACFFLPDLDRAALALCPEEWADAFFCPRAGPVVLADIAPVSNRSALSAPTAFQVADFFKLQTPFGKKLAAGPR
jgi:hypothetical protein